MKDGDTPPVPVGNVCVCVCVCVCVLGGGVGGGGGGGGGVWRGRPGEQVDQAAPLPEPLTPGVNPKLVDVELRLCAASRELVDVGIDVLNPFHQLRTGQQDTSSGPDSSISATQLEGIVGCLGSRRGRVAKLLG